MQQFRRASVVGLTTGLVGTIAVTLVLWQGGGITGMFATEAVVGVLNLLWTGHARTPKRSPRSNAASKNGRRQSDLKGLRRAVGRFALLSSIGLFLELIVGTRSEFFFLAHYSSDAQIAFYSIAYSAVAALRLIPTCARRLDRPGLRDALRRAGVRPDPLRLLALAAAAR